MAEIEKSGILSFGRSIDALHKNRIEMFAAEFNERCHNSIKQGIFAGGIQ
ncbi:hypothetical protein [Sodalis glossinidius]|nr:hypothetical protein [Sodalis glossinidius]